MSNRKNKTPMDKKSATITWVIVAAIMVFAAAGDGEAVIPAVATLLIVTVILLVSLAANKKTAQKTPAPAKPARQESVRRPDERPEVKKLRARRGFWRWMAFLSAVLLALLPKERLGMTLRLFERYGFERAVQLLWRAERGSLYGLLIFAGLALVLVVGLLRVPALSRRIAREPDNIPAAKPAVRTAKPAARAAGPETESAVTCEHHSGKEKYLRQLDGYLSAGLIDKNEYRTLKERYSKLDIPEDYH